MPQLDLLSFLSQFFWFSIGFWALYVVLFKYFLIPTAMSLKIREYLSNETGSVSAEKDTLLSDSLVKDADKVYTVYGVFASNTASSTFNVMNTLFNSIEKDTKKYILSSTEKKALDYAMKKAAVDFLTSSSKSN